MNHDERMGKMGIPGLVSLSLFLSLLPISHGKSGTISQTQGQDDLRTIIKKDCEKPPFYGNRKNGQG